MVCLRIMLITFFVMITSMVNSYGRSTLEEEAVIPYSKINNSEFNKPDTIYRIKKTINLKGSKITIPNNCTLLFEKGSIKNGTIVFQNTKLDGNVNVRCNIEGNIVNETVRTDWFLKASSTSGDLHDTSKQIQEIFNLGARKVCFGAGYYHFHNIQVGCNTEIIGKNTIIRPVVLNQNEFHFNFLKNVFYANAADTISIRGIKFFGEMTGSILPSFKSETTFGEPLIWVDKAKKVVIENCVFKNIENCTYCNKAYNYYGKKQGSCVCLWDVSDASYVNCEQVNCCHDEQVWIIAVDKPIMDTKVTFTGNYIHDMTPGPNSSAFTCVAGTCQMENNRVERYNYPGSMFNVFAKKVIIRNNEIKDSYCSSVFDVCEYSYFHNDEVIVENNNVDAVNSALVLGQSAKVSIRNNVFRGIGLYYSANNRIHQSTKGYKYWYADYDGILPTDVETVIDGNVCDFTGYDGNRSIAGTKADYGTGEIREAAKYNDVGVNYGCGILIHPNEAKAGNITITNNQFTSLQSLEGVTDKNNLAGIYPHTIRLVNTENVTIRGNTFNGCYRIVQSPDEFTCISIYNYPDVMEKLERPNAISHAPSQYERYVIEDNVFNVPEGKTFYPFSVYTRTNATRKTPLVIKELVLRNNKKNGLPLQLFNASHPSGRKSVIKQLGEVKFLNETFE